MKTLSAFAVLALVTGSTHAQTTTVLPTTATWNYLHPQDAVDPAIADTDFNTTWYTQNDAGNIYDGPGFNDSGSVYGGSGSGLFGYGVISLGAITENISDPGSGERYTAYFVTTFDLGAVAANTVTDLTANILADDGAFVYINGQPAAYYHTIPGNDTYLAGMNGNGNVESLANITLDKSLLIDGVNSIAVSVHQKGPTSSDLGFQMEVVATVGGGSGNVAPTIAGTVAGQNVDDDATIDPFSGVTIGDADGDSLDLTATLSAAANGALAGGGFVETGSGTGIYTYAAADPAAATTAIQALTFTPTEDQVAPGNTVTTTFTISVDDGAAASVTDSDTTVIATAAGLPGNDAPIIVGTVAGQNVNDNTTIDPFSGVTIGDADGDSLDLTVTLSTAANGALAGGGFVETGSGTGIYTYAAADPAAATTAIQALTFTPTEDQVAPGNTVTTTFTISIDDGTATAVTDSDTTVIAFTELPAATIDLADYVLQDANYDVGDPVTGDLSGVTYSSVTDTLFTVINGATLVVELNRDGTVTRTINLTGFDDTEGIVHLGGNKFGILEEKRRNLVTIDIGAGITTLDRSAGIVIPLGAPNGGSTSDNLGLEGVAYDAGTDTIYAVWEKSNPAIRSFDLSIAEMNPGVTPAMSTPFDASNIISPTTLNPLTDLAGLHFHAATNTLLVLGEENKELVEVSLSGVVQSGSILLTGPQLMSQPEGVTVLPDGTIYIVGEADDLLTFVIPDSGGGNDFSDWIAGYPGVGGLTGFNDDPDNDGNGNGVENFFGTAPDAFTQGLVSGTADTVAGTFTFTHPQTGTIADDLTATYQWSVDLENFFADGVADGGVQVDFVATPNTPSPGTTTVVATVTGPIPEKLFVDVEVTQN